MKLKVTDRMAEGVSSVSSYWKYSYFNRGPRLLVNPILSWVTIQHECKLVQNIGWRPDWILSDHCPKCVFEHLSLPLSLSTPCLPSSHHLTFSLSLSLSDQTEWLHWTVDMKFVHPLFTCIQYLFLCLLDPRLLSPAPI